MCAVGDWDPGGTGDLWHPLGDPVPEEVKQERRDHLLELQAGISRRKNRGRIGRTLEVLVEGAHPESEHLLAARWRGQAPEVDGRVILTDGTSEPGELAEAVVDEGHEYDLVARLTNSVVAAP